MYVPCLTDIPQPIRKLLQPTNIFLVVSAQGPATPYEDPETGIVFDTWTGTGITWGYAFPSDAATVDATEYIGYLVGPKRSHIVRSVPC